MKDWVIGFIGAGSIAEAMIRGLLGASLVEPGKILVCNRSNNHRLKELSRSLGVSDRSTKAEVISESDLVILAVKPKDLPEVLLEIRPVVKQGQVFFSLAAGVSTAFIESVVGKQVQVIRAMPNTSCLVSESATAVCCGSMAVPETLELAVRIFQCVGKTVVVPEHQLDAVTGLSGTGPAYVYLLVEGMIRAGIELGLDPGVARDLVIQTVIGSAKMLAVTGEDPVVLRQKVTSPGGTTQAGIKVLSDRGFNEAVVQAIHRAAERSRELGSLITPPHKNPHDTPHATSQKLIDNC